MRRPQSPAALIAAVFQPARIFSPTRGFRGIKVCTLYRFGYRELTFEYPEMTSEESTKQTLPLIWNVQSARNPSIRTICRAVFLAMHSWIFSLLGHECHWVDPADAAGHERNNTDRKRQQETAQYHNQSRWDLEIAAHRTKAAHEQGDNRVYKQ